MRTDKRHLLPHNARDVGRGGVDQFVADGIDGAQICRRGLSVVLGIWRVPLVDPIKTRTRGLGDVDAGSLSSRRLDERAQSESFAVLLGVPAAIHFDRQRLVDEFADRDVGTDLRRPRADCVFDRVGVRGSIEADHLAQEKYRRDLRQG